MDTVKSLQIVIIEDQEAHFVLMQRAVAKELPKAKVCHFADARTCLEHLGELDPDVIVTDYQTPGMTGLEFLEALPGVARNIPVVMITGQGSESIAVQAMKLGAWDYLVKSADFFKLLPGTIEKVVKQRQLRDSLQESARLNELLLNSLPHPAMLIRRDRKILAANRIAVEMGARINDWCWRSLCRGEYIPERTKRLLDEHPGSLPPNGTHCIFCRADKAFATSQPTHLTDQEISGKMWERWWIPIDDSTVLAYAIDVTDHKQSERQIHLLTQQLIRAQEMERQRLAYDLHDSIGQELSSLKIGLDTLINGQTTCPPETKNKIGRLSQMLQGTIDAVRNLAHELRPAILDQLGLVRTLEGYCEEYSARNDIPVDFFTAGMNELELDYETRITLYRLVQESLNNIRKHATARWVKIRLVASYPNIILHIEDDGVGFDVSERLCAARDERCMGLHGMAERVALLSGTIKVESRPGHGTKIRIEVPIGGKVNGSQENRADH
jgi:signal transduction histidine kinase